MCEVDGSRGCVAVMHPGGQFTVFTEDWIFGGGIVTGTPGGRCCRLSLRTLLYSALYTWCPRAV